MILSFSVRERRTTMNSARVIVPEQNCLNFVFGMMMMMMMMMMMRERDRVDGIRINNYKLIYSVG